jgi:uncharacterized protein (DUF2147 family)
VNLLCEKCAGELRNYRCSLRVTGGGRELEVRGYAGIPLLGRTQTWKRKE